MKKMNLLIAGCLISITFWFLESLIHFEIDKGDLIELLPKDINELWMRSLIVTLIIAMSVYAQISQTKERKIEREKSLLLEQLLDEQYRNMELILDTRKQTQEALRNFNNSVNSIKEKIEEGESLPKNEVSRLLSIITSVQNKLDRLWS